MDRRNFLKLAGTIGATLATTGLKAEGTQQQKEFFGVLTDTTLCIGCRACEKVCGEAHNLEVPDIENDHALDKMRTPSEKQWTVVNQYETEIGKVYVKQQCMHCWQPACTAACLTNAMLKTEEGPVIWRGNKCLGCRYCMAACPFNIPKYEYNSWNPKVQKCNMCWERLKEGKKPACVEACPTRALLFGKKRELVEIARTRIYQNISKYVHQIYGEYEVGGTGWLYLSAVPFEQLGFRTDLGTIPYPEYTKEFLYAVPLIFFGAPALLLGLNFLSKKEESSE